MDKFELLIWLYKDDNTVNYYEKYHVVNWIIPQIIYYVHFFEFFTKLFIKHFSLVFSKKMPIWKKNNLKNELIISKFIINLFEYKNGIKIEIFFLFHLNLDNSCCTFIFKANNNFGYTWKKFNYSSP